jgi:plastocyanin
MVPAMNFAWMFVAVLAGCSSGATNTDAGATVNGCTAFEDDTAGGATVTGPSGATPAQYTPNCVHIKVGQSVTWNSNFTSHPLAPFNGDTPNPITSTATGTTASVTFANPGTFGFHCGIHTTLMEGAVQVTP